MSYFWNSSFSNICYKIFATAVILIIAVLIDWWIFKIINNPLSVIYSIGFIGLVALVAGIIINIWE